MGPAGLVETAKAYSGTGRPIPSQTFINLKLAAKALANLCQVILYHLLANLGCVTRFGESNAAFAHVRRLPHKASLKENLKQLFKRQTKDETLLCNCCAGASERGTG